MVGRSWSKLGISVFGYKATSFNRKNPCTPTPNIKILNIGSKALTLIIV